MTKDTDMAWAVDPHNPADPALANADRNLTRLLNHPDEEGAHLLVCAPAGDDDE